MKLTEDKLCEVFAEAVKNRPEFESWVLFQTKFALYAGKSRLLHQEQASIRPRKHWWRHWWCYVPELNKEHETDIFMVFETLPPDPKRFALHIENKRANYHFGEGQAEAYGPRARYMLAKSEFLNYTDFSTILLAPSLFKMTYPTECELFDVFIPYEALAGFLPEYDQ